MSEPCRDLGSSQGWRWGLETPPVVTLKCLMVGGMFCLQAQRSAPFSAVNSIRRGAGSLILVPVAFCTQCYLTHLTNNCISAEFGVNAASVCTKK